MRARLEEVSREPVLQTRHGYQNAWGYILRMLLFLGAWIVLAWRLRTYSLAQDRTQDAAPTRAARTLSGVGIVIYGLLGTFAAVDSIMSLEKRWYSTIFPVIVIIGQVLCAYTFSVIMLALFRRHEPLASVLDKTHYHQLGNLLLTFVLFWTYVSFSQFLIIYSGDLPPELEWYLHRIAGGWKWLVIVLAVFHFFVPFFLLLFRSVKRQARTLTIIASLLFAMHLAATYWLVMPSLHQHGLALSWLDLVLPAGIGGIWLSFVLSRLKQATLLPQNDPGMQFAFKYGH